MAFAVTVCLTLSPAAAPPSLLAALRSGPDEDGTSCASVALDAAATYAFHLVTSFLAAVSAAALTAAAHDDATDAPSALVVDARPESTARQVFRKKLREGQLDDREIEIDVAESKPQLEIMGPAGMEDMTEQLRGMFSQMGQNRRKTRKMRKSSNGKNTCK
jgi:hypothetical protein